jgi:hypothetical protein
MRRDSGVYVFAEMVYEAREEDCVINRSACLSSQSRSATCVSAAISAFVGWQPTAMAIIEAGPSFFTGQILVVANGACGSSVARTLSVRSTPLLPGVINGQKPNVDRGAEGLPYSISPVVSATSYFWEGTNGISIATGQGTNTVTVDIPEALTKGVLRVAAANACGQGPFRTLSLTGVEVLPFVGGRTFITAPEIKVYPNPARDKVIVQGSCITEIHLYDISGRLLQAHRYQDAYQEEIKLGYPQGMYIIQVFGEGWQSQQKVVVQ